MHLNVLCQLQRACCCYIHSGETVNQAGLEVSTATATLRDTFNNLATEQSPLLLLKLLSLSGGDRA